MANGHNYGIATATSWGAWGPYNYGEIDPLLIGKSMDLPSCHQTWQAGKIPPFIDDLPR